MGKYNFDNKTIIITGASSGIGRELSRLLIIKHNCNIIGVGRSEEKMIDFQNELGDKKENFSYYLFDVGDELSWKNFANKISEQNIDMLINNAGILPPFASFDNLSSNSHQQSEVVDNTSECDELTKVLKINYLSIVYSCHYILPIIEKSKDCALINIASSAGLCALPGITTYSASKGAVKNFTESLMLEKNYYVGLVCPGFTKTDIFRSQTRDMSGKLINLIATNLDKMTYKIYNGIRKCKRRMVYGFDAKCMDFLYRHFPKSSIWLFRKIMKKSNIDLFKDIF